MAFGILIDGPEYRIQRAGESLTADWRVWDVALSENVWFDAIGKQVFRLPVQLSPDWATSATASDRVRLAETNRAGSSWKEHHLRFDGDVWLLNYGTSQPVLIYRQLQRNQGIFVSVFNYARAADNAALLTVGWGDVSSSSPCYVRVFRNGWALVYYEGEAVAEGSLVGEEGRTVNSSERIVDILILPCQNNALLVASSLGGGILARLPLDDVAQEITPAGYWSAQVHDGTTMMQLSPVRFAGNSVLYSLPMPFLNAPPTNTQISTQVYGDKMLTGGIQVTLVDAETLQDFQPDGVKRLVRFKAVLSGEKEAATVYALGARVGASTALVPNRAVDITGYAYSLSFSASDDGRGEGRIEIADGQAFVDEYPNLAVVSNQRIWAGATATLIEGRAIGMERRYEGGMECTIYLRDRSYVLEQHRLNADLVCDGLNMNEVIDLLLDHAGLSDQERDVDTIDYEFPSSKWGDGRFVLTLEVGTSIQEALLRLKETYFPFYIMTWQPTATMAKLCIWNPENHTTPVATVYPSSVYSPNPMTWERERIVRKVEPEANDLWVVGRHYLTGLPIVGHYRDEASIDAGAQDRGDNWLGEVRHYGLLDESLSSLTAITYALGVLRRRLTRARWVVEFTAPLILKSGGVPAWVGDVVTLYGTGNVRITSLRFDMTAPWAVVRPLARYTGELLQ